jgi:hypothetical protein
MKPKGLLKVLMTEFQLLEMSNPIPILTCEDFMVRHAAERTIAHVFEKCGLALGEEAINKHKKHLIELSQEKPYAVLENEMYRNVLAEVMALELAVDEAGE